MNPSELVCKCGHDGYAHGLPGSTVMHDSACDLCNCSRFTPPPDELLDVLLGSVDPK